MRLFEFTFLLLSLIHVAHCELDDPLDNPERERDMFDDEYEDEEDEIEPPSFAERSHIRAAWDRLDETGEGWLTRPQFIEFLAASYMDDVLTHETAKVDIQEGKLDPEWRDYLLLSWRKISKKHKLGPLFFAELDREQPLKLLSWEEFEEFMLNNGRYPHLLGPFKTALQQARRVFEKKRNKIRKQRQAALDRIEDDMKEEM